MKPISFFTNIGDLNTHTGYGIAGFNMVTSLQKNGYKVTFDDSTPSVQLNFCQPPFYGDHLSHNQYNIHLYVFESTELQPGWAEIMQEVDEIWTASEWNKNQLEDLGFKVAQVYPHGIEPMFIPKKKRLNGPIKFLHNGIPAPRKGGQQCFNAFRAAFGNSKDVQLILKAKDYSDVRKYDHSGSIIGYPDGNVKLKLQMLEREELPGLYHNADVFVGNSAGEGFGFPMLEALATGTPAIVTKEWAEYKEFLGPLGLESRYIDSPWPDMHPGKVTMPEFDDLVDKMRFAVENIDSLHKQFYAQAFQIHDQYDWEKLTKIAFEDVNITK